MKKSKAHILIVDDDDRIRELVKQYLNEYDYLVTTANSAEDAQEKILIIKFDLIVLDIMMPGKSGLEFIKDSKNKLDTPVILAGTMLLSGILIYANLIADLLAAYLNPKLRVE